MLDKIRKFTKLSSKEKKLFLEAYVTLGIMRAAILLYFLCLDGEKNDSLRH